MADEDEEGGGSGKSNMLMYIIAAVGGLLVVVIAVVLTLFLSGAFSSEPEMTAEERLALIEAGLLDEDGNRISNGDGEGPAASGRRPPSRPIAQRERFEATYMEIERSMIANITNSRKVIQVNIALMTHYDRRVFDNVERHEFALRSAVLDRLRQITETELNEPEFRSNLAHDILMIFNSELERLEDFGGIEAVHFTEFVVQ